MICSLVLKTMAILICSSLKTIMIGSVIKEHISNTIIFQDQANMMFSSTNGVEVYVGTIRTKISNDLKIMCQLMGTISLLNSWKLSILIPNNTRPQMYPQFIHRKM